MSHFSIDLETATSMRSCSTPVRIEIDFDIDRTGGAQ